jgi:NAD(P)H dehydrogenase (quinone)
VVYKNVPEAEYKATLASAGLPEPLAGLLIGCGDRQGGLFDESHQLRELKGKSTASLSEIVAAAPLA